MYSGNESHGHSARESSEHTQYEMIVWFDKHLKSSGSTNAVGDGTASAK
jgi:hypothetical protein